MSNSLFGNRNSSKAFVYKNGDEEYIVNVYLYQAGKVIVTITNLNENKIYQGIYEGNNACVVYSELKRIQKIKDVFICIYDKDIYYEIKFVEYNIASDLR